MTLLAVPNLSEGRDSRTIAALQNAVSRAGANLLDSHSDAVHNRTVLTATGDEEHLVGAMVDLAIVAARLIDLTRHEGVHPRLGALDVCPFVFHQGSLEDAAAAAVRTARRIGEQGFAVFLYGFDSAPSLPELRRQGLEGLSESVAAGRAPDFGPAQIRPGTGIVCVGARGPLIAFNVNLAAEVGIARGIAARVRETAGGPVGVRALGLPMPAGSQVSMNLTQPERAGIPEAFDAVALEAARVGAEIVSTEIVGLVEERFLPQPDAKAARLLIEPGRSLESALKS